jgi:hypothetical protein
MQATVREFDAVTGSGSVTTEATRWASRNMDRPFTILGLNL